MTERVGHKQRKSTNAQNTKDTATPKNSFVPCVPLCGLQMTFGKAN
jgi:hypothetical protein